MKRGVIFLLILLVITVGLLLFVRSGIEKSGIGEGLTEELEKEPVLNITFLDVGQGDATFIEFPDGQQMLIDCAIDARVIEALGRTMPFYDRDIDYLVVTHPDLDHYGGCIDVLNRFDVGHILYNGFEKPYDDLWQEFDGQLEKHRSNGKLYTLTEEQFVWNIASTTVNFLYPDHSIVDNSNVPNVEKETGANDTSVIIKLSYGDQDVILTGDAEEDLEEYLITIYEDQLDVEILKAGHHGSKTASIEKFVSSTSPDVVVVSAGKNNKFGHPSRRVLKRFERASTTVWRTDVSGDILISVSTSTYDVTKQF